MRYLTALILPLLLCGQTRADVTLEYTTAKAPPDNTLVYYVKGDQLRFIDAGSPRVNLFDAASESFVSAEPRSGTIARIDADIIAGQVEHLNRERLQKLADEEARLREIVRDMDSKQGEIAESLINQLKYPEFYGAHTLLRIKETGSGKTIGGVPCRQYDVTRQDMLVKQLCMASPEKLAIDAADYRVLRKFFAFNYMSQTRLLIASGQTGFTYIDYDKENIPGLPLEITEYAKNGNKVTKLLFKSISSKLLDSSLFKNPLGQK